MDAILEQLKAGVRQFQTKIYPARAAAYALAAGTPQRPHTLFITCSDSRIDPVAITNASVGDLFVTRNIGNMVPLYNEAPEPTSAAIEYAVSALGVGHVVVCGHSDCGAMKALLNPQSVKKMPAVENWLRNAAKNESSSLLPELTEQNVLQQMAHLKTHPSVVRALAGGKLTLSGWVYEIGSGEIRIARDGERSFIAAK